MATKKNETKTTRTSAKTATSKAKNVEAEVKEAEVEVKEEVKEAQPAITPEMLKALLTNPEVLKAIKEIQPEDEGIKEVENKTEKMTKARKRITSKATESKHYDLDKKALVPVRKIASGEVGYRCKLTNQFISWTDNNTEHMLSIEELIAMNGESEKYLYTPWLLVDDVEFMEAFGLTELYSIVFETEDLIEFFSQSLPVITSKLKKMPKNLLEQTIQRAVNMINTGELVVPNLLAVIKLLKNEYNIDIKL